MGKKMDNRMRRHTLLIYIWCILCAQMVCVSTAKAEGGDSVRFSLLTCSPGEKVYELFGHTGIRYRNFTKGYDVVFNYGVFDFNTPNFVMRFVRGETDYQLGAVPFHYFIQEYEHRGSSVTEQDLALLPTEAARLDSLLRENYLPENRIYRYNYFYDNCTTRARDRIESALGGITSYPPGVADATFRGWVRKYTKGHPWADFGINLCLGSEADRPISGRKQMFLPENMMQAFSHGTVHGGGDLPVRKLLAGERVILERSDRMAEQANGGFLPSPMTVGIALLVIVLACSLIEWRRRSVWWGIDLLLFTLQGVAGCIIAFLFFFSTHPTVDSNWLIIILNPLPLIFLPWMIHRVRKGKKCLYDVVNAAVLTLFIAFLPLIPQKISLVVVTLALDLLIRSALHLAVARKKRKVTERNG